MKFEVSKERLERKLVDAKPAYSQSEALAEASRCLYCYDAPCITACPTGIDIPTFIKKISTGNRKGSAKTILDSNILGYSCARVCPVEVLCVGACVYNDWERPPIQIGKLQRFATEWLMSSNEVQLYSPKPSTGKKIALVGAGPASLSCAAALALEGHEAVLFERDSLPGGLNTTGVAPYKLHAEDSLKEVAFVQSLGVKIETGKEVGKNISAEDLLKKYDAVFLGVGLGEDTKLGIIGEDGPGVVGATAMIRKLKLDPSFTLTGFKKAIVVGGGNTAIDACRELAKLGVPSVTMVYRRSVKEMPGYFHEWKEARMEGVTLLEYSIPVAIQRSMKGVTSVQLARCETGKPLKGTEWFVEADIVVMAIGQSKAHVLASQFSGVQCDEQGCIQVALATGRTGNPKVFSGGDCINGGKEVVNAVADGKRAAQAIHQMLERSRG